MLPASVMEFMRSCISLRIEFNSNIKFSAFSLIENPGRFIAVIDVDIVSRLHGLPSIEMPPGMRRNITFVARCPILPDANGLLKSRRQTTLPPT